MAGNQYPFSSDQAVDAAINNEITRLRVELEAVKAAQLTETQRAWNERDGEKRQRLAAEARLAQLKVENGRLRAEATELLKNAEYADGYATVLTQDCEALEDALSAGREG